MSTLSYIQIQEHPNATAIGDDDLCASCRKCKFCPGDLSLCELTIDGMDFPAVRDEDGHSYACEHFDMIHDEEINQGVNLVDPVTMLGHDPIPPGFMTQLHAQSMIRLQMSLPADYDPKILGCGRLFHYQLHTGETFSIPLLDIDVLVRLADEAGIEDAPVVRMKTISVLSTAMALMSRIETGSDDEGTQQCRLLVEQLRTLLLSATEFRDDAALISMTFEDFAPELSDDLDNEPSEG